MIVRIDTVDDAVEAADAAVEVAGGSLLPLARGLTALVVVYLLGRLLITPTIGRVVRRRNARNPTLVEAIERYTRLLLFLVATAVGVVVAGYADLFGGSAIVVAALTLALGVAGREVIGNVVSGLFLVSDPEFNVGDWIEWADGVGVVETIRFRVTRVRTASNEVITVPNTILATTAVTRPFSGNRIRSVVDLTVGYDGDLDLVETVLTEEALALEDALEDPAPLVTVDQLGGDGVEVRVVYWLPRAARRQLPRRRSTYLRRIKTRLEDAGVSVSPPAERELSGTVQVDGDGPG